MLILYDGGGCRDYWLEGRAMNDEQWRKFKETARSRLLSQGQDQAATILEIGGYELHRGANGFGDEFYVLYRQPSLDEYLRLSELSQDYAQQMAYRQVAELVTELGFKVRFVGVEPAPNSSPEAVRPPTPRLTSAVVETALADAQRLVSDKRPVSAVDRAHTALHGYLKQVCVDATLVVQGSDPSLTELFKAVIKQHPKLTNLGAGKDQIQKILRSLSAVCDALNPIRNQASLAHPNEELLEDAEAMLAINASRTLLNYLDQKLGS